MKYVPIINKLSDAQTVRPYYLEFYDTFINRDDIDISCQDFEL